MLCSFGGGAAAGRSTPEGWVESFNFSARCLLVWGNLNARAEVADSYCRR